MRLIAAILVLTSVVVFPAAHAGEPVEYTRFLIPVYSPDLPGAFGSLWQARTWLRYSGDVDADIVPRPFCFGIQCPLGGVLEPGWPSVPFQTLAGFPESAILVHVDSRYASRVTFESRIRDLSRSSESAGTEVPVIREDRIANAPVYLLNVPLDVWFRHTLRVYALPEIESPEVEIRYFRQPDDSGSRLDLDITLLKAERLHLRTRRDFPTYQLYPSVGEVGNFQLAPELAGQERIWIEVVPVTPGLRIWAFASVTNNETQEVTLVTPSL
ncbi:MAG: hypothetical protein ABI779_06055 [Acidobacteriota bacterium]